jgi:hypothetical protein
MQWIIKLAKLIINHKNNIINNKFGKTYNEP